MPNDSRSETCGESDGFRPTGLLVPTNDPPAPDAAGDHVTLAADIPPALLDDISERLRDACAHLEPEAFAALVLEIARTKLRFARRAASLPGVSGLWDPPDEGLLPLDALTSRRTNEDSP
jgi:hypothetical protein